MRWSLLIIASLALLFIGNVSAGTCIGKAVKSCSEHLTQAACAGFWISPMQGVPIIKRYSCEWKVVHLALMGAPAAAAAVAIGAIGGAAAGAAGVAAIGSCVPGVECTIL